MATLVHLSDLHLLAFNDQQTLTIDPLIRALGRWQSTRERAPDLVAITGDVFDSVTVPPHEAVQRVSTLLDALDRELGVGVPTVILPGNHDRRAAGLLWPNRLGLFVALAAGLGDRVKVLGNDTPFLATWIDPAWHGLPVTLVALDSTHVPTGLVGAGGVLRQEDILQLADRISDTSRDRPVVLLTHHHLVPTPLADLSRIDVDTANTMLKWLSRNVLARLVVNADHEEMMMTALGAGTALSTLHTLDRAVVVLHGHKHFPAARMLRATQVAHGDVLLAGAGSAGTVLTWNTTPDPESAHLWPSFNVMEIDGDRVAVENVAFAPARTAAESAGAVRLSARTLIRATRDGTQWRVDPVPNVTANTGRVLASNVSTWSLSANAVRGAFVWDARCTREVHRRSGNQRTYVEAVEAAAGARLVEGWIGTIRMTDANLPSSLRIPTDGTLARFRIVAGICRNLSEGERCYDAQTAFEWVDLLNRYQCDEATLILEGAHVTAGAFGSAVDLTTGLERHVRVERDLANHRVTLRYPDCPPRTLLRILWPLER